MHTQDEHILAQKKYHDHLKCVQKDERSAYYEPLQMIWSLYERSLL